jgi:trehalose utilization protein
MEQNLSVTVWNEHRHEQQNEDIAALYPEGIHGAIAGHLDGQPGIARTRTATLDEAEHGLGPAVLDTTDVLVWWSHVANAEVSDEVVDRVHQKVLDGMGLIVLHSAMKSKIFLRLTGTTCNIKWREDGKTERLWVVDPAHPIADGLGEYLELPQTEMYGEHFDIPRPDELVFISWFEGGEVFRSGCCYHRGRGRVFYLRPGHEDYPIFHQQDVLRVLYNACLWAAPTASAESTCGNVRPAHAPAGQ